MIIKTASGTEKEVKYISGALGEVLYIISEGSLIDISSFYGNSEETKEITSGGKTFQGYTKVENIVRMGENIWRVSLRRP